MRSELQDIFDEITGTKSYDRLIPFINLNPELLEEITLEDLLWEKISFIKCQDKLPFIFDKDFFRYWNQIDTAAKFLDHNSNQTWSLHLAVGFKDFKKIKVHLKDLKSINTFNVREETPLHIATMLGDEDIVIFLLKNEADVHFEDNENLTAIDYSWNQDIFKLLKSKGAQTKSERDLLMDDYCKARTELNDVRECNLALMQACEIGKLDTLKKLFSSTSNKLLSKYFAYPSNNKTPLHLAVENNHIEIIDFLIKNGFLLDKKDIFNKTPLDYARELNYYEIENKIIIALNNLNRKIWE